MTDKIVLPWSGLVAECDSPGRRWRLTVPEEARDAAEWLSQPQSWDALRGEAFLGARQYESEAGTVGWLLYGECSSGHVIVQVQSRAGRPFAAAALTVLAGEVWFVEHEGPDLSSVRIDDGLASPQDHLFRAPEYLRDD